MKRFFALGIIFLIIGCGEDSDIQKAALLGGYQKESQGLSSVPTKQEVSKNEKIVLEEMKYQNKLDLAKIEAEKAKALEHIGLEKSKLELSARQEINALSQQVQKEIALAKEQQIAATKDKDIAFYQIIMGVIAVLILFGMALFLWVYRKNRNDKLRMHEEKLKHEAFMQASRQQHEKVSKILEIVVDEKTDKTVKKELVKLLKEQGEPPALLEYR